MAYQVTRKLSTALTSAPGTRDADAPGKGTRSPFSSVSPATRTAARSTRAPSAAGSHPRCTKTARRPPSSTRGVTRCPPGDPLCSRPGSTMERSWSKRPAAVAAR